MLNAKQKSPKRGSQQQWKIKPTDDAIVVGETPGEGLNCIDQEMYTAITSKMCDKVLSIPATEGWIEEILPNIGLTPGTIAQIAKKNNGTFVKDMRFSKLISFEKQVDYIANNLGPGWYYLTGKSNAARHHSTFEEVKNFRPEDYCSSVVLKKDGRREGVIEITTTRSDKIEIHQRSLTSENVKYYFSDTYVLYYMSEDPQNSIDSSTIRKDMMRRKREEKQNNRRAEHQERFETRTKMAASSSKIKKRPRNRGVKRRRCRNIDSSGEDVE